MARDTGTDAVIPFAVKAIRLEIEAVHVLRSHPAAGGIAAAIQPARDREASRGRRPGNELDDGFIVTERFAAPIGRDERKEPMFDLVPLARPGREVTDRDREPDLIGEGLQRQLPEAEGPPVAPPP